MESGYARFQIGLEELQERLSYRFKDVGRLESSLYHYFHHIKNSEDPIIRSRAIFERNEKLGDGLLKVAIQSLLSKRYSSISAGELSARESIITCNVNLAHVAVRLQIPNLFFHRTNVYGLEKKALADTMEALFFAIALDAGDGETILGIPALERVCDHVFKFELASCQITNPYKVLKKELGHTHSRHKLRYETIYFRGLIIGFVAKITIGKILSKKLGIASFSGTGFTPEAAREKASSALLLVLRPTIYPSHLVDLNNFSWKIGKVF